MTNGASAIPAGTLQALPVLQRCFGETLIAVYLYGSAVAGGLRPLSDIDLMAIVDRPMTPEMRRRLADELLRISGRHPANGGARPLEVIVFQRADLSTSTYPARSEFLYGEWLRAGFEAGAIPEPASAPDFTLVLAQARQQSRVLIGPPAAEILPVVPQAEIRHAIVGALPALLDDLEGDERNVLLTLARMWRTVTTGEFVPKDVAADWAISRSEAGPAGPLALARDGYLGTRQDDWRPLLPQVRQLADDLAKRVVAKR